jgi:hypothetical protein
MEFNGDDFRKALYEDTRDRHNQELANAIVTEVVSSGTPGPLGALTDGSPGNEVALVFKKVDVADITGISKEAAFESGKWGKDGALYVDGYTYIYAGVPGTSPEALEQQVVA